MQPSNYIDKNDWTAFNAAIWLANVDSPLPTDDCFEMYFEHTWTLPKQATFR